MRIFQRFHQPQDVIRILVLYLFVVVVVKNIIIKVRYYRWRFRRIFFLLLFFFLVFYAQKQFRDGFVIDLFYFSSFSTSSERGIRILVVPVEK